MTGRLHVLVLDEPGTQRARLTRMLAGAGLRVVAADPDLDCPRMRTLAATADVIVLDVASADDVLMEGLAGWEQVERCRCLGKPVVALLDPEEDIEPAPGLALVQRAASADELVRAILHVVTDWRVAAVADRGRSHARTA